MVTEIEAEEVTLCEHEEELQRKSKNLPLMATMATDDTDQKTGGQERLMDAEGIDDFEDDELDEDFEGMELSEGPGKMLPQAAGALEGFAS